MTTRNYEYPEPDIIDMMSEKEVRDEVRRLIDNNIALRAALKYAKEALILATLIDRSNTCRKAANVAIEALEETK